MSKRITVSLSDTIYQRLLDSVSDRQISKFVSDSVEQKLTGNLTTKEAVEQFFTLQKKLPIVPMDVVQSNIKRGRM